MPNKPKLGDARYRHVRGTCLYWIQYFSRGRWQKFATEYRDADAMAITGRLKAALKRVIREARENRDE